MNEIAQIVLAVGGSSTVLGVIVLAVFRSLPFVTSALDKREARALVRAQTALVRAQAKVTSEAVTQQQLREWREVLERRLEIAEAVASAAEQRATEAERRAAEREVEHARIVRGLRAQIADLEQQVEMLRDARPRPSLPPMGEPVGHGSAAEEHVTRREGDER